MFAALAQMVKGTYAIHADGGGFLARCKSLPKLRVLMGM